MIDGENVELLCGETAGLMIDSGAGRGSICMSDGKGWGNKSKVGSEWDFSDRRLHTLPSAQSR